MHAVMGTMRKMQDPEMEDKIVVATSDSRLTSAVPPNGISVRKRSLGAGGGAGVVAASNRSKTALREVDKWKRVAAYKAAMKQRPSSVDATTTSVYLNGRKMVGRRMTSERDVRRLSEMTLDDGTRSTTSTNNHSGRLSHGFSAPVVVHREENVPMDLSRRTTADDDGGALRGGRQQWCDDRDHDDELHYRDRNGSCLAEDDFVQFDDERTNNGDVARIDEPLNLSRSSSTADATHHHSSTPRWNAYHLPAPPNGQSANHSDDSSPSSSDELNSNTAQHRHPAQPVLQQKRVRLEEMVSFIRKCSTADGATSARHHHHRMEDSVHQHNPHHHHQQQQQQQRPNGVHHDWNRSTHQNHHNHRRRYHYQRHLSASDGNSETFNGGGYDVYRNGEDCSDDDEVDDAMELPVISHPPHHSDFEARNEMTSLPPPPSYDHHRYQQQQHQHQLHRRRKSATPYRGASNSSPHSLDQHANHRAIPERTDDHYEYDDDNDGGRPEHLHATATMTNASAVGSGNATNSSNGVRGRYPVLRQQLQGMSKRNHPASTQTTTDVLSPEDRASDDEEEEHIEQDELDVRPDVVRAHHRQHHHGSHRQQTRNDLDGEEDDDERHSANGAEVDQPLLTQQHLRLLAAAAAPPLGNHQFMAWPNYAYYAANLLQGLQGSLVVTSANNSSNSQPISQPALPLTLSLPLSVHGSGPRSGSPGSMDDEEDDDQNTLDLSSPETQHHKNNGGSGLVTGGAANGGGLVAIASEVAAANAALFRKRAPRALTGKHVKHGTGASPTTLMTLRQKIEQKRQQQMTSSPSSATAKPSGGCQKSKASSEGASVLLKTIKTGTAVLQKKTMVS